MRKEIINTILTNPEANLTREAMRELPVNLTKEQLEQFPAAHPWRENMLRAVDEESLKQWLTTPDTMADYMSDQSLEETLAQIEDMETSEYIHFDNMFNVKLYAALHIVVDRLISKGE